MMKKSNKTYTYRCGKKIELEKSPDQMVVRILPDALDDKAIITSEQVSSASCRVTLAAKNLEAAMQRSREIAPTHHAYYEVESGQELLTSDRVLVTFYEALTDQQLDEFIGRYALLIKEKYNSVDYLFQLTDHTGMNPVKLVVLLTEEEDLVENAELDLNQRMNISNVAIPSDPEYQKQWHLHTHFNDSDFDSRSSSLCEDAWHLLGNYGDSSVVVAVSDDGCKLDHIDFDSATKFAEWGYLRGEQLISSSDIGAQRNEMYKTGANHGTSCCGVIGGEVDARLTVGAAPNCQLLPIQWESSGTSLFISASKLLTVLNFIADKADVMSNSWGSPRSNIWPLQVTSRIHELATIGGQRGKGIVFLWAAGNDNSLINHIADQQVPYSTGWRRRNDGSWVWIGVKTSTEFENNLVGIPAMMHIAALSSTAKRSHYSNYGPGISLCAPSSNSHTYSRIRTKGLGIRTTTGNFGGVTPSFGGTSSATPLVAGISALVISANPELTAVEVVEILKRTASQDLNFDTYPRTPPANFDTDTSWDVSPVAPFDSGDFFDNGDDEGLWSPWFGHGCVDAEAAVSEALNRLPVSGNKVFSDSSTPDRSIPDNNIRGIKDSITCSDNFILSTLTVSVNISHTYIADLLVTLIAPSGTSVALHNRAGGSANDIHRAYTSSDVPALHNFNGESVNGKWTLRVQDLATADRGRLQNWSLELSGREEASVFVEETPGLIIPDNNPDGIRRVLPVSTSGLLDDITIDLDITHTYISDLIVELRAPDHTSIILHNHTGGSADNIIKSYSLLNTGALQALRNIPVEGDWVLKVSDQAGADQGKLNRWALKIAIR